MHPSHWKNVFVVGLLVALTDGHRFDLAGYESIGMIAAGTGMATSEHPTDQSAGITPMVQLLDRISRSSEGRNTGADRIHVKLPQRASVLPPLL